jgi:hypothetical protein
MDTQKRKQEEQERSFDEGLMDNSINQPNNEEPVEEKSFDEKPDAGKKRQDPEIDMPARKPADTEKKIPGRK